MKKLTLFLIITLSACSTSATRTMTNNGDDQSGGTPPITLPTSFINNVLSTQSTFNPAVQIIFNYQIQSYSASGAVSINRFTDDQVDNQFTSDILRQIMGKGVTIASTTDPDYYARFINSPKGNEYVILRSYKRNFEFKVREVVSDKLTLNLTQTLQVIS